MSDEKKPDGRTYVVLRNLNEPPAYAFVADVYASNAEQAIMLGAEGSPGRYVAVPERNWTEMQATTPPSMPPLTLTPIEHNPPLIVEQHDV